MREMRAEENRLLADRVQMDRAAVRRLQRISIVLAAVAVGLLGWIAWLLAGIARRQRQSGRRAPPCERRPGSPGGRARRGPS